MDFISLSRHVMRTINSENATETASLTRLPASLLETFIPGYSLAADFVYKWTGFDVSILVTAIIVLVGFGKAYSWLWSHIFSAFNKLLMSRVYIDEDDDLFDTFHNFVSAKRLSEKSRSMKVQTVYGSNIYGGDDDDESNFGADALGKDGLYNYRQIQARMPPRYDPYYGVQSFWHNGSWFRVNRSKKTSKRMSYYTHEEDYIEIATIGFSIGPIKRLLEEMKAWSMKKSLSHTRIRRANTKSSRRGLGWSVVQARPSRPMSTVILDGVQKDIIIRDCNEFLHPATPKWYAARGVPLRRGYLFTGPPGTGKTSLSFALAGLFGLDLFCLALNDPEITESDVLELFNSLPRRCIVLLEDIDEAGLKRPDHDEADKEASDDKKVEDITDTIISTATTANDEKGQSTDKTEGLTIGTTIPAQVITAPSTPTSAVSPEKAIIPQQTEAERAIASLATALATALTAAKTKDSDGNNDEKTKAASKSSRNRKRGGRKGGRPDAGGAPGGPPSSSSENNDGGISLSGLLNAIDGVATHEGRILIMTTNHPEALDEALIRPGRVDVTVNFDYASRPQIRELFLRMYGADLEGDAPPVSLGGSKELELWAEGEKEIERDVVEADHCDEPSHKGKPASATKKVETERLEELAALFAERMPDKVFSPSVVQGYLLLHKKSPLQAVEKVVGWRDEELRKKREKEGKTGGEVGTEAVDKKD